MNFVITALKLAEVNKNFLVLFCILIVIVKAYTSLKIKQTECNGKFNVQDLKIETIEKSVQKIEVSTTKMQATVTEIKDGYHEFVKEKNRKEHGI